MPKLDYITEGSDMKATRTPDTLTQISLAEGVVVGADLPVDLPADVAASSSLITFCSFCR